MTVKREDLSNQFNKTHCSYITGDIVEVLETFKDGEFPMIYADPPYKVGQDIVGDERKKELRLFMDWTVEWLSVAVEKLQTGGHLYISFATEFEPYLRLLITDPSLFRNWNIDMAKVTRLNYYLKFRNLLIMHQTNKHKPYPLGYYNYNYDYEPCLYFNKGLKKQKALPIRKTNMPNAYDCVIECKSPAHAHKRHPTQKPLGFYEHIIMRSSDIGQTILDCFTGSGNMLIKSNQLGRNAVGIDIDPQYVMDFVDEYRHTNMRKQVKL